MDPNDGDDSYLGDWADKNYPPDPYSSPFPNGGDSQSPWPGYPAAPSSQDLIYVPSSPTDVVFSSSLETGVGRYLTGGALPVPTTSSDPLYIVEITSSTSSTPEPQPIATEPVVTTPDYQEATSTSTSEVATPIQETDTLESTSSSLPAPSSTSSDLSSIPQSTGNATETVQPASSRSGNNTKKLAVSITVPIVVVLLAILALVVFLVRRRRRRRAEKAATSSSEVDSPGNGNGVSHLQFNGQSWDIMPTPSHDVPFTGPIPRKPVPQVSQVPADEPYSPVPRSRSHTLQDTSSQNSARGVDPPVAEGRQLPLIDTNIAAMEAKEANGSRSRSTLDDPENDAVSDISDRSDGRVDSRARDRGDISPVSSISEDWDQAYTMRYTATGQAAHVHIPGDRPPS